MLNLFCLGPWQMGIAESPSGELGQTIVFSVRKEIALLAYLAVEHTTEHTRDSLLGIFFPEDGIDTARNNLRVLLSRLRTKLGESGAQLLRTNRLEVQFDSTHANCWLDVSAVDRLIAQAAETKGAARLALLEQAAALHRGEFLQGLTLNGCEAFDQWLVQQREHQLTALGHILSELAQSYEAGQQYADMARVATRQLALDPLNEAAHQALIRALLAQGKRVQALAQFDICVRALKETLNIEPSPETQHLVSQIRRAQATVSGDSEKHNLPTQLTSFVGRRREMDEIVSALLGTDNDEASRLVTLMGEGGVGKTRMALQVGLVCRQTFTDGVYFVSLASLTTIDEIPSAVLQAMQVSGTDQSTQQTLLNVLRQRHVLLILDNAEHLLGDGAAMVALLLAILSATPRVSIVVTSRQRLGAQAEDVFVLRGLAVPTSPKDTDNDAIQLFASRARRAKKNFSLTTETLPHVIKICNLVDGMPLAIELAAAAIARLSCEAIANEVASSLDALSADLHDLPHSHRSIRACFERSWQRCSADEQAIVARLSIFQESFSIPAALNICSATSDVLVRLHDSSLLAQDLTGADRYSMHPLLRSFLREKLQAQGLTQTMMAQHAACFHAWMAEQERILNGDQPGLAMAAMRQDLDNLRVAWTYAISQHQVAMMKGSIVSFAQFAREGGVSLDAMTLFRQAIDACAVDDDDASKLVRGLLLQHLSLVERDTSQTVDALAHAEQAVALVDGLGDPLVLAGALDAAALACVQCYDLARGEAFAQRAIATIQRAAPHWATAKIHADALLSLVASASERQDHAASFDHLQQALRMCEVHGLGRTAVNTRHALAIVYGETGQFQRAVDESNHVIRFAQENKLGALLNRALIFQATVFDTSGDYARAQQANRRALAWAQEAGSLRDEALLSINLGISYDYVGRYAEAIELTQRGIELWQLLGRENNIDTPLVNLALHYHHSGADERARTTALTAIGLSQRHGRKVMQSYGQTMLGHAEMALGCLPEATAAYMAAHNLAQSAGLAFLQVEPAAGLARVALRCGDATQALAHIEPVLHYLSEHPMQGMEEPFRVHLTCVQALLANHDVRVQAVLARAQALLNECAERITDVQTRDLYLNGVVAHEQLRRLG